MALSSTISDQYISGAVDSRCLMLQDKTGHMKAAMVSDYALNLTVNEIFIYMRYISFEDRIHCFPLGIITACKFRFFIVASKMSLSCAG